MENSSDYFGFLQYQDAESVFPILPTYTLFPCGIDFGSKEVERTPKASSAIPLYAKFDDSWMNTLP